MHIDLYDIGSSARTHVLPNLVATAGCDEQAISQYADGLR